MNGLASARALFAGLVTEGVGDVVVSPGSRSALLAIAADAERGLRTVVHTDERSAAFFALGLATAARRPVGLVCTSGSAAANYLPAVVEAHERGVPLVVLTADRPPELRGVGAGQTIDQLGLYGRHVRWFAELPVGGEAEPHTYERAGRRATAVARGPVPGPVHLNCPFRDPLYPDGPVDDVATPPDPSTRAPRADAADAARLAALAARSTRGLLAVGPADLTPTAAAALRRFSATTGWPILADIGSGVRPDHDDPGTVIGSLDLLFATDRPRPDILVRVGPVPTSRALRDWMQADPPGELVLVDERGLWSDPTSGFTSVIHGDVAGIFEMATKTGSRPDDAWQTIWRRAAGAVQHALAPMPGTDTLSEPDVALHVAEAVAGLGPDAVLWLSSSMPVRDADTYVDPVRRPARVLTNRGANGIDGVVSSALGAAAAGIGPVVALVGDLALLHDVGGLLAGPRLATSAVFVVPNNDGGGIFSHLPVSDALPAETFRRLFHTPTGVDLAALGAFAGISHTAVTTPAQLAAAVRDRVAAGGVHVVEVPVETEVAVARRRAITDAARASLLAT